MRSSKFQKIIAILLCMMMCFEAALPAVALTLDPVEGSSVQESFSAKEDFADESEIIAEENFVTEEEILAGLEKGTYGQRQTVTESGTIIDYIPIEQESIPEANALSANTPTLVITTTAQRVGTGLSFDVDIGVMGCTNLKYVNADLWFDESRLEWARSAHGSDVTHTGWGVNGTTLTWNVPSGTTLTNNYYQFARITFRVLNNAPSGNAQISFEFNTSKGSKNTSNRNITWADSAPINIEVYKRAAGELSPNYQVWDGATLTEPLKNSSGVYQIRAGEELAWLEVALENRTIPQNFSAELVNDIDLGQKGFVKIGSPQTPFLGEFNGNYHTVYNYLRSSSWSGSYDQYEEFGLFGMVGSSSASKKAVIKNLVVSGKSQVFGDGNAKGLNSGGIVGGAINAEFTNLVSKVSMINYQVDSTSLSDGQWNYVGGVIGWAKDSTIKNCANYGRFYGYNVSAGVVGYIDNCIVENCYNLGKLTGNEAFGGIVGYVITGTVKNCFNMGTVAGSSYYGATVGDYYEDVETADLYYLDNSCDYGYGSLPSSAEKPVSKTVDQMKSQSFVDLLNRNAGEIVFKLEEGMPMFTWEGASSAKIYADYDSSVLKMGNTRAISFKAQNNPGFTNLYLRVTFDTDVLEYVSLSTDNSLYDFDYGRPWGTSPAYFYFDSKDGYDITEDIYLFRMGFLAKENSGVSSTTVRVELLDSRNANNQPVVWSTQDITLTIAERDRYELSSNPEKWNGETLTEPKQVDGVYQIAYAEQFAWFMYNFGWGNIPQDSDAVLTKDIDLNEYFLYDEQIDTTKPYLGVFDGQGHTIKNYIWGMQFNTSDTSKEFDLHPTGLFTNVGSNSSNKKAAIKNLKVTGSSTIEANFNVVNVTAGGIISYAENAELSNLISEITIDITASRGNWNYVGGVVAKAKNCKIDRCANLAAINYGTCCGGVVGYAENCTVTNSYNRGVISGKTKVGGIVGELSGGSLSNCYNTGKVSGSSTTNGAVLGKNTGGTVEKSYYRDGSGKSMTGTTSKKEADMKKIDFVNLLNQNAGEGVFMLGNPYPEFLGEIMGDLVKDGVINTADGDLLFNYLNGYVEELTDEQRRKADMTGEGELTLRDAMLIYDAYNA